MKLFNTLTKRKEEFVPVDKTGLKGLFINEYKGKNPLVTMYNCGPTVYNFAHIGNLSAYLMADFLRRVLEYEGYEVKQVKNITDVGHMTTDSDEGEDKMEKAAREQKKDPYEIARSYEEAFKEDEKKLRIREAHVFPRATEHIEEMIAIIKTLIENGHAYVADDGVYFDIKTFPEYGSLSGNTNLDELLAGARIDINENKKHPMDFALWKLNQPNHIMQWDSPWGVGFPGWHIECSAMSTKYLGETLDIHTGGQDNIFPHHECEIAQCECAFNKPFVRYWMHKGYLNVEGKKMAKSAGNFYTLRDLEDIYEKEGKDRTAAALHFRYLVLSSHYRSSVNFSFDGMKEAEAAIGRLEEFYKTIFKMKPNEDLEDKSLEQMYDSMKISFESALMDDLNTPKALAVIFTFIKDFYKKEQNEINPDTKEKIIKFFSKFNLIFDVLKLDFQYELLPNFVMSLKRKRENARRNKDFKESDSLREKLMEQGYSVIDNQDGTSELEKLL